jgi:hypothetical protein
MKKSNKVIPKKRRGRPATGKDPVTALRLSSQLTLAIEAWANDQVDQPSRSEAIRRLVKLGLGKSVPTVTVTSTAKGSAERAKELAGKTIDGMVEPAASAEEKAVRKRRLIKGPEEFRGSRIDRARTKDK